MARRSNAEVADESGSSGESAGSDEVEDGNDFDGDESMEEDDEIVDDDELVSDSGDAADSKSVDDEFMEFAAEDEENDGVEPESLTAEQLQELQNVIKMNIKKKKNESLGLDDAPRSKSEALKQIKKKEKELKKNIEQLDDIDDLAKEITK